MVERYKITFIGWIFTRTRFCGHVLLKLPKNSIFLVIDTRTVHVRYLVLWSIESVSTVYTRSVIIVIMIKGTIKIQATAYYLENWNREQRRRKKTVVI